MLPQFVKDLLANPLVKARIKNGINAASIGVGAATLDHMYNWLLAHATYFSQADSAAIAGTVASCAAGLVLTVGSAIYSTVVDPANVNAKVIAAAATGDASAANDASTIKDVKAAVKADAVLATPPGTPGALDALVAKLSAGKV